MSIATIQNYNLDKCACRSECLTMAKGMEETAEKQRDIASSCYDTAGTVANIALIAFIVLGAVVALNFTLVISLDVAILTVHPLFLLAGVAATQVLLLGTGVYYLSQHFKYMDNAGIIDQKAMHFKAKAATMPFWKEPSCGIISAGIARLFSQGDCKKNLLTSNYF